MELNPPAAVTDGNDPAVGATGDGRIGLDVQEESIAGAGYGGADVDAVDIEHCIGEVAPVPLRAGSRVRHVRVSFGFGRLVATNSKRP